MTNDGLDQATKNSTTWDVLNAAHAMLRTVVRGVDADGWTRPTPCEQWTVTQVLQHAAGDQLAFAAAITGGPRSCGTWVARPTGRPDSSGAA